MVYLLGLLTVFYASSFGLRSAFAQGLNPGKDNREEERINMVATQIESRGVKDQNVLAALRKVPRHLFVAENTKAFAYDDNALPIECRQTISQPYIVGLMTELARIGPGDKILEIGTGSGYQAAVLAELAEIVFSIEIIPELAQKALETLNRLGYTNIQIRTGDGYQGWPEQAPFDAIVVTAAAGEIPNELVKELKIGGRMVIPLGDFSQELYVLTKNEDGTLTKENIIPVRFVPMIHGKNKKNE
ncbi:MAG: protein-L-isoaspartate(D-aspartate) O-methyltransferase [Candidatus Omnitrophota bacterium]